MEAAARPDGDQRQFLGERIGRSYRRARQCLMKYGPFVLRPIGRVESTLLDPAVAPKQANEGAPPAWLVLDEEVADGLRDLQAGDEVLVLTWLDRARRDVLVVHPRDDPVAPETGVFSTRSADRPNPIGIHHTNIMAVEGLRILVRQLEAVDGTPVVDLKPVLAR